MVVNNRNVFLSVPSAKTLVRVLFYKLVISCVLLVLNGPLVFLER